MIVVNTMVTTTTIAIAFAQMMHVKTGRVETKKFDHRYGSNGRRSTQPNMHRAPTRKYPKPGNFIMFIRVICFVSRGKQAVPGVSSRKMGQNDSGG